MRLPAFLHVGVLQMVFKQYAKNTRGYCTGKPNYGLLYDITLRRSQN